MRRPLRPQSRDETYIAEKRRGGQRPRRRSDKSPPARTASSDTTRKPGQKGDEKAGDGRRNRKMRGGPSKWPEYKSDRAADQGSRVGKDQQRETGTTKRVKSFCDAENTE